KLQNHHNSGEHFFLLLSLKNGCSCCHRCSLTVIIFQCWCFLAFLEVSLIFHLFRTLAYKNRYVRVPDGHFWIEGDHHGHSLDSNSFGPVSVGLLHGRASHIIWPPNRWQRITASLPANRGPLDTEEED
uniref:Mitochondrial inner membrane protease subunit 2-like n=1 Tax=Maylandia zebra TaxID=106582 RepID=A0A3P9DEC2_9CICH